MKYEIDEVIKMLIVEGLVMCFILLLICVIGIISMILPESAFSKGLYAFCMNCGMIIWFVRELFRKQEEIMRHVSLLSCVSDC